MLQRAAAAGAEIRAERLGGSCGSGLASGLETYSSRLASDTNGMPACSLSPVAQVETVDTPIVQPAGISFFTKRVAQALSSGTNSPLSPA